MEANISGSPFTSIPQVRTSFPEEVSAGCHATQHPGLRWLTRDDACRSDEGLDPAAPDGWKLSSPRTTTGQHQETTTGVCLEAYNYGQTVRESTCVYPPGTHPHRDIHPSGNADMSPHHARLSWLRHAQIVARQTSAADQQAHERTHAASVGRTGIRNYRIISRRKQLRISHESNQQFSCLVRVY